MENSVTHHQHLADVVSQLQTLARQHPGRRLKVTIGIPRHWPIGDVDSELHSRLSMRALQRVAIELQPVSGACRILAYEFDVD